ncbi:protein regulator of cytokinesis 1-like [Eublepharis macularius]|uniref:Protein regulator of cytokinesis 1-like n=1 Tax=Eublepharis macularius TaxID=481883 RepID=A0AA97L506_EUBMA|nr:protein regulator of cytokinesis 1-like [Eublepharis macularius]XP_054842855.1 protein regulator of cytokinesis 1-like [Eublepharis macularius]
MAAAAEAASSPFSPLRVTKPPRESEVLATTLVNSVTQALTKLLDLWNEMGMKKELQLERMQTVKTHIETLLNEMLEEESNLKEKIEYDIEIQKKQLSIIRSELKLDAYQVEEDLSILQLEREFRLALEAALKEKKERVEKLRWLQQEDQALCSELCATPYYIPTGSVPSSLELKELEEHVQNLLRVKEQRLEEFLKVRREIRQYNKEIGHEPDGTLENEMLFEDDEYICLTKKNIEELKSLVCQLQVKKESLTANLEAVMKEVQLLWDRFQWPQEQQAEHKRITSKCSISEALKMWEQELQNLEERKKEQLKDLIFKVRQQLDGYWKRCFYSDEQRAVFQPFYNDDFSEDLLNQHDEELLKIKHEYEKNRGLYDTVQKWEATWDRFIELENKSTDPSRLLNRGGNLLKDERERSKIQKQLLKLTEDLKKSIENWEKENGSDFLINNERLLESIDHQLEQHKVIKDRTKMSVKRNESTVPKSGVKRPAGAQTPTPNKLRKKDLSMKSSSIRFFNSALKENLN